MRKHEHYVSYPPESGDGAPGSPPCPKCGGLLYRIPRNFLGRLISLFVPVRHYRCESPLCHWTGHLRHVASRVNQETQQRRG